MNAVKLSIRGKLLLMIAVTSVISAIAMGIFSQVGFRHSFAGYLTAQCRAKLQSLSAPLASVYEVNGNWSYLHDHPETWYRIVYYQPEAPAIPSTQVTAYQVKADADEDSSLALLTLLDADKRPVIGVPLTAAAVMEPVVDKNQRTIGWVALEPRKDAPNAADSQFEQRQTNLIWEVCLLTALLAVGSAVIILRSPISTLQGVASSMHRLVNGQYDTRVESSSRDEAGQLARDLNLLARTLDTNDRMRRSFFAAVSHDLRTPISILQGELEALEDGVDHLTIQSLRSFHAEVSTLGKLVNDLYDLSVTQIGAPAYHKSRVDLRDQLRQTMQTFRDRMSRCHLTLLCSTADDPLYVLADERRLQQLFTNLLENSARYTDEGGTVRVTCIEEDGCAVLDFEDTAPGVPDDALPHLFDYLYRVEASRNRDSGGAGLGLAICRNIVDAHDGRIDCQHSTLGGLHIQIRLPLLVH